MVTAIESDVALVIVVMRVANKQATSRGKVRSIPQAIDVLKPAGVEALIGTTKTFDFFERTPVVDVAGTHPASRRCDTARGRSPVHAGGVSRERRAPDHGRRCCTTLASPCSFRSPCYPAQIHKTARTPEQRVHAERRELGIDHALVGGVMARRWGLPQPLAAAIEHHHGDDVSDEAALVRWRTCSLTMRRALIGPDQLLAVAPGRARPAGPCARCSTSFLALRPAAGARRRPAPLSGREPEVLRRLAEGKVYKQIALELDLSTSTVRTHLHTTMGSSARLTAPRQSSSRPNAAGCSPMLLPSACT